MNGMGGELVIRSVFQSHQIRRGFHRVIRPRLATDLECQLSIAEHHGRQRGERQGIYRDTESLCGAQDEDAVVSHLQRDPVGGIGVGHPRLPTEIGVVVVGLNERRMGGAAQQREGQNRRGLIRVRGAGGEGNGLADIDSAITDGGQHGRRVGCRRDQQVNDGISRNHDVE